MHTETRDICTLYYASVLLQRRTWQLNSKFSRVLDLPLCSKADSKVGNKRKFSDQTMTVSLEDKFHKNNLLLKSFTFNMVKQYMQNQSGQKQHTVNIFIVLYKKRKELQKITLTRVKMGSRVSCIVMTSVEWNWCFFLKISLITVMLIRVKKT